MRSVHERLSASQPYSRKSRGLSTVVITGSLNSSGIFRIADRKADVQHRRVIPPLLPELDANSMGLCRLNSRLGAFIWTRVPFFPFCALLNRLNFYSFRQELVTRYLQAISDFCFEARYSRAAKAIFCFAQKLLGICTVCCATVLVILNRYISKYRST